jgi:hypothetical protein
MIARAAVMTREAQDREAQRRQERLELMLWYARLRWTRGHPRTWRGRQRKVG